MSFLKMNVVDATRKIPLPILKGKNGYENMNNVRKASSFKTLMKIINSKKYKVHKAFKNYILYRRLRKRVVGSNYQKIGV